MSKPRNPYRDGELDARRERDEVADLRRQVGELSMRDDIVAACMSLHRRGDLTYEQALELAVVKLAEGKAEMIKQRMAEPLRISFRVPE